MKHKFVLLMLLVFISYIYHGTGASFTNFKVNRYETCNNTQLQIKFYPQVTKINGKQFLSYNLTLPFPIGDNIGMTCLIQTKTIGNNYVELFTIREKNLCKAFNKYLGEFWYDIKRGSLMAPGVCPIQQGRYHGHDIELYFEKITLQTFPFGTLRFTIQAIDKANNNSVCCLFVEVDNILN